LGKTFNLNKASRGLFLGALRDTFENGTRGCSIAVLHMELSYERKTEYSSGGVFERTAGRKETMVKDSLVTGLREGPSLLFFSAEDFTNPERN